MNQHPALASQSAIHNRRSKIVNQNAQLIPPPDPRHQPVDQLRPYRDAQGKRHALVIFTGAHQWPAGKKVFLNGQERDVSLDLYDAMKSDPRLKPFPG